MRRCESKTKSGRRCLNSALPSCDYCRVHAGKLSEGGVTAAAVGALLGHAVLPGLGGALIGGATASFARKLFRESRLGKKKVFVSFDFDNDRAQKEFIIGQARHADSPFEVTDHS
jgi:hypothetical protein